MAALHFVPVSRTKLTGATTAWRRRTGWVATFRAREPEQNQRRRACRRVDSHDTHRA